MNLLGLVFSILLILSYGYYAIGDKHVAGNKLFNSYTSHNQAGRNLSNQFMSEFYNGLREGKKEEKAKKRSGKKKKKTETKEIVIGLNRECARLNLWPLIHEGRENHPQLYDLAVKLIRTFYGSLCEKEKRFEYRFLEQLIKAAKDSKSEIFSLEKLSLIDPDMQKIYYKMLKGSKGCPPLLDYVKAEASKDKICIYHAHPDMLTVLFNPKIATKLYTEIHKQNGSALSRELIDRIASEMHVLSIDPELFTLLTLTGYFEHEEKKKVFIAKEGEVLLRKNLILK